MDLEEYLKKNRISQTSFSNALGISRRHLLFILQKKSRPSLKVAKKIEELTDGSVKKEYLLLSPEDAEKELRTFTHLCEKICELEERIENMEKWKKKIQEI